VKALAIALLACLGAIHGFAQLQQQQPPVIGQDGASRAQPTTRSIIGTVLDKNGAPVPKAVVLLKDTKTLQVRSFIAQKDGTYHFYGLSSDINYELRAQANGFTSPSKLVSVFDSHQVVTLNLKLKKRMKS
jgi:hypothetical protein